IGSGSWTGSRTAQPREFPPVLVIGGRPGTESTMRAKSLAAIVASLHARSGKTLLARVLVEHFILAGGKPLIFDTDAIERRLCTAFPYDAIVLDVTRVRDQMALFDTLAKPFAAGRVVD